MQNNDENDEGLLAKVAQHDEAATSQLLDRYRSRLKRMVRLRLDPQISRRFDESDVVQDALLDATAKINDFAESPDVPFYLWLRQITLFKILEMHRRHLTAERRDVRREIPLLDSRNPNELPASSIMLAEELAGNLTSPSQTVVKSEFRRQLTESLEDMDPIDREVLMLRHFEQLTTEETAEVLGLSRSGAGTRYMRALDRLRNVLRKYPDFTI